MNRSGDVYYNGHLCGVIEETIAGFRFTYDSAWLTNEKAMPVSLTMPLRKEPYDSDILFSFFDGIIPEGWLLEKSIQYWKLDYNDRFGLLLKTGNDTIGAVSIMEKKL